MSMMVYHIADTIPSQIKRATIFHPEITVHKIAQYFERKERSFSKRHLPKMDEDVFENGDERLLNICDGVLCS